MSWFRHVYSCNRQFIFILGKNLRKNQGALCGACIDRVWGLAVDLVLAFHGGTNLLKLLTGSATGPSSTLQLLVLS